MSTISIDDFKKVELRTAKILEAHEIPGADKIWKLLVDVGTEKKELVAGVKAFYSKEVLVGKTIIVVNNLAPAIIRGTESKGMLLVAKNADKLTLLTIEADLPPGSVVG